MANTSQYYNARTTVKVELPLTGMSQTFTKIEHKLTEIFVAYIKETDTQKVTDMPSISILDNVVVFDANSNMNGLSAILIGKK